MRDAKSVWQRWYAAYLSIGRTGPTGQYGTPSARQFRSRLAGVARRYGVTVERVKFNSWGFASEVIVQTDTYRAFARAAPTIERILDPHTGKNDRTGWSLPGFFLEAQDERGVPFLIVHNFGYGGGQWARSDQLYPFVHG